jgi:Predicted integral membrane protein (DUF2269)
VTKFLLSVHVLAAILAVGPVAVAASVFPRVAREAAAAPGDGRPRAVLASLHRVCRVYSVLAVAVPVFGVGTAQALHVLGSAWLLVSIGLTVLAAAVLIGLVLPAQSRVLAGLGAEEFAGKSAEQSIVDVRRLAMPVGVFNLLWAAVTVLMVVRPGSTTGA